MKVALIRQFISRWPDYCMECFRKVNEATQQELEKTIKTHFGPYAALRQHVFSIVERLRQAAAASTMEHVRWLMSLEDRPLTFNDHYFSVNKEHFLAEYKQLRQQARRVRLNLVSTIVLVI